MIFFENLKKHKDIFHGVMEKKDGPINPGAVFETEKNILKAVKRAGFKKADRDNLFFSEQVHGKNIFLCKKKEEPGIKPEVDGLISKNPGQILIVKTADCAPILFYDPGDKVIGAIHTGRKGLENGIIEQTIGILNTDNSSLIIALGPHIRKCCYYSRESGEPYDLTEKIIQKLLAAGAKKENIEDCNLCSFCREKRFWSLRREGKEARAKQGWPCNGSFIGLKK